MAGARETAELEQAARLLAAVAHPIRIRALIEFRRGERSSVEIARIISDPAVSLGVVAYHVRRLARDGLIAQSGAIRRRGAIETRYELSAHGHVLLELVDAAGTLPDAGG